MPLLFFILTYLAFFSDSKDNNIMMDWSPIYDFQPHPKMSDMKADWSGPLKPHNRTTHPVRYYLIDWDLSRYFDPELGIPSQNPGYGGDRTVPEFQRNELCNPFAVDVYCLGNVIRRRFFLVGMSLRCILGTENIYGMLRVPNLAHQGGTLSSCMSSLVI